METSRIFVRDLPPNLSSDEFCKHFSKLCPITDGKLIQRRRIGYIGYGSSLEAQKAVKYFDKSFLRMSRLRVEMAKTARELVKSSEELPESTTASKRRKTETNYESGSNPRLQEFLEVMQPPSRSKTWANEAISSGENLEEPKKEKDPSLIDEVTEAPQADSNQPRELAPSEGRGVQAELADLSSTPLPENQSERKPVSADVPPLTDAEWQRSRSNRLLGLDDGYIDRDALPEIRSGTAKARLLKQAQAVTNSPTNPQERNHETSEHTAHSAHPLQNASVNELERNLPHTSETGRLFLRNLSYQVREEAIRNHFSSCGAIEEIHIPVDSRTGQGKGIAYLQFEKPDAAKTALSTLDASPFQGRLLHILSAAAKKQHTLDEHAISKLPIKKQKQIRRKLEAASSTFSWNSLYMNTDAIISSLSDRLGISKAEILDPTSSSAAIRQAHAETNVIQESKAYFNANGVNLDAFGSRDLSDTIILAKNFSFGTSAGELKGLFEAFGTVVKLLLPPSGTIAIVELELASQARSAFSSLAYRKIKDSVLFLERAPRMIFGLHDDRPAKVNIPAIKSSLVASRPSATDLLNDTSAASDNSSTLYIKNLNFSTTSESLRDLFRPLDGFLSAVVKIKADVKRPGQTLSMGFGFAEFRTKQQAQSALVAMNGHRLEGHDLQIKTSHRAVDAAAERKREDQVKKIAGRTTKIIIKNLPFETSKHDVRSLFSAYGQLRSVRLPQKFDASTRGFAFADFVTAREAENAMDALRDTHLLGRRLVLEYAAAEATDPEEEIEKMAKRVERQADKVALQNLTGGGRRRFNPQADMDEDMV